MYISIVNKVFYLIINMEYMTPPTSKIKINPNYYKDTKKKELKIPKINSCDERKN